MAPGSYSENVSIAKSITILGRGATLVIATTGPVVDVQPNVDATIYDLRIDQAHAANVHCGGGGVSSVTLIGATISRAFDVALLAEGGCTVTLEQNFIWGNGGGINVLNADAYHVRNNMIVVNGKATQSIGGAFLGGGLGSYFEFNTVAGNSSTTVGGVYCYASPTLRNNIVYANTSTGTSQEVDPACVFQYSDIGPQGTPSSTNMNVDPMFKTPTSFDYTLGASSPVRNTADPASTVNIDFQGEIRPQGPGREPGADEIP
jgi:hypothetical protein